MRIDKKAMQRRKADEGAREGRKGVGRMIDGPSLK